MAISTDVKQNAQSRAAISVAAFYPIAQTDFGVLGGPVPVLAYNAGAGSLAMSTARAAISWITAQGESMVSAEQTVSIAAGTGAFTITQPTVPVNGATVLGWRVYSSSGGAGSALLNVAANSTTQVQSNIVTTQGTLLCFPVATTSVQVLIYGAGQAEPTFNRSGIQPPLPSIAANTTAEVGLKIPESFSPFRSVLVEQPNANTETAGISLVASYCRAPLWPASTAVVAGDNPTYIVTAGALFVCTTAGTTSASNSFPAGFVTTAAAQTGTVTDNTATWTFVGNFKIVSLRWMNATGTAAIPVANTYLLSQTL